MRDSSILQKLESESCIALRYVNDSGQPTMEYPLNPNGSAGKYGSKLIIRLGNFISVILKSCFLVFVFPFSGALAGVCSLNGRHLAMMPHPERCTQMWQWPWAPAAWDQTVQASPWMRMFHNAYTWCIDNS